jgi:hypothetical protein
VFEQAESGGVRVGEGGDGIEGEVESGGCEDWVFVLLQEGDGVRSWWKVVNVRSSRTCEIRLKDCHSTKKYEGLSEASAAAPGH